MFWICGEEKFTYGISRKSLLDQIISEIDLQLQNLTGIETYSCSLISKGTSMLFIY